MKSEEYASSEEKWFSYYVQELLDAGILINAVYQPESIVLSEDVKTGVFIKGRTENKFTEIKLLNGHDYTADWYLSWEKSMDGKLFWLSGGVYNKGFYPYSRIHHSDFIPFYARCKAGLRESWIDVKGTVIGRNNTSAISFPLNQKWAYANGVFVQKIVVSLDEKGIFARTFTPARVVEEEVYKIAAKKGETKLKYKPVTLEQWLS